jgi:hypothetical protein
MVGLEPGPKQFFSIEADFMLKGQVYEEREGDISFHELSMNSGSAAGQ